MCAYREILRTLNQIDFDINISDSRLRQMYR